MILKQGDCIELMQELEDNSIDCILTDPPYKYLNHKLDLDFYENLYFKQVKRVLKDNGFIVLFGRGSSFYRWNTILDNLGFVFKEEIIWNKNHNSSPLCSLQRVHETISIHTKKNGIINKVRVNYLEQRLNHFNGIEQIITDVKRIKSALNNTNDLNELLDYLENGNIKYQKRTQKHCITTSKETKDINRVVHIFKSIKDGLIEKSIMNIQREHYKMIHPTQKPARLLERLIALVTKENDLILDTFAGSGSTGEACYNTNRQFVGYEIDDEYFNLAKNRLENLQPKLFTDV